MLKQYVLGLAAFLASLAMSIEARSQTTPTPLNIGTLRIASQTDVFAAEKYGLFAKHGIAPNLVFFNNGADGINALQGRSVDVLLAIFGSGLIASSRGFDLVPIFQDELSQAVAPDTSGIHVLNDSGINTLKDLAGKKIGVGGLHTQNTVAVQRLLKKQGVDLSSVQLVEMPFPTMLAALKAHTIDAVNAVDPFTTQIRVSGISRTLAYNYIETIPEQPLGVWFTRKSTIDKNMDVLLRFNAAMKESLDLLKSDSARAKKDIAEYTKLDPGIVEAMPMTNWNYKVSSDKWQAVIDMLTESGDLTGTHKTDEFVSSILKPFVGP
jgi:NitT/TauT family transport system substrate-binding protein